MSSISIAISYISFLLLSCCCFFLTSILTHQSLPYILISLFLFFISYLLSHSRFWSCKQIVLLSSLLFSTSSRKRTFTSFISRKRNYSKPLRTCIRLHSPSLPVSLPSSPLMISLSQSAYTHPPQRSTSLLPTSTGRCRLLP